MNYALRPMRLEDIPQVAEIERESFPTSWPPTSFKRELSNRLACYLVAWAPNDGLPPNTPEEPFSAEEPPPLLRRLLVTMRGLFGVTQEVALPARDFVVGYVGTWFMTDEAHIVSIAVRESHRGLGIGELLLMGDVELAVARRARVVTLEVRVSNTGAQALYEKYGFREVGICKGYYADNREDAVVMNTDPILSPEYQGLMARLVNAFRQRRGETLRTLT